MLLRARRRGIGCDRGDLPVGQCRFPLISITDTGLCHNPLGPRFQMMHLDPSSARLQSIAPGALKDSDCQIEYGSLQGTRQRFIWVSMLNGSDKMDKGTVPSDRILLTDSETHDRVTLTTQEFVGEVYTAHQCHDSLPSRWFEEGLLWNDGAGQ